MEEVTVGEENWALSMVQFLMLVLEVGFGAGGSDRDGGGISRDYFN